MEARNILPYKDNLNSIPLPITVCRSAYESLSIFSLNLSKKIKSSLNQLLMKNINWVSYIQTLHPELEFYLDQAFTLLSNWIEKWKDSQRLDSNNNSDLFSDCESAIQTCNISLLSTILYDFKQEYSVVRNIAIELVALYPKKSFDELVLKGKLTLLEEYITKRAMRYEEVFDVINQQLLIFIPDKINTIFQNEITRSLNLTMFLNISQINNILQLIFGTFPRFQSFVYRNSLYEKISKALTSFGVDYQNLCFMQNHALSYKLKVVSSLFQGYEGIEFEVDNTGVSSSDRYIADHLITFGNFSNHDFKNDISIPDIKQTENINAVIFINTKGLNLFDLSERPSVKVQLRSDSWKKLKGGRVLMLSRDVEIRFEFREAPFIGGNDKMLYAVCSLRRSRVVKEFFIEAENNFYIGRSKECSLSIPDDEIENIHLIVYRYRFMNSFYVVPYSNECESFYLLKKKKDLDSGCPSQFLTLKENDIFQVNTCKFLVMKNYE